MTDFLVAFGLVLVLEGIFYAVAPEQMKRMIAQMLTMPSSALRLAGLAAMVVGVVIVWLARA